MHQLEQIHGNPGLEQERPLPPSLVTNERISFSPFDSASSQPMIVCQVPTEEGGTVNYAIPARLQSFLDLFDGERTTDTVIQQYCTAATSGPTRQQMERLVREFFLPRGILVPQGTSFSHLTAVQPGRRNRRQDYLRFKVNLLPARVTYPLAKALRIAFTPAISLLGLLTAASAHAWFYLHVVRHFHINVNSLDAGQLLIIMLISTAGGIVHELGHATALVRYGGKRPAIGWGVYFVFTVLYTDLSEAWRLHRKQRAVIDLAGIYLQGLFLVGLIALYWTSHAQILIYAILWTNLQMAEDLNPFLRMDGYWFVTDILGLANLREQVRSLFLQTIRSKPASSHLPGLPDRTRWLLRAYVLLSVVFFVYLAKVIFVQAAFQVLPTYPGMVAAFARDIWGHSRGVLTLLVEFIEVFWRSIFLLGLVFLLKRLVQWVWQLRPSSQEQMHAMPSDWRGPAHDEL